MGDYLVILPRARFDVEVVRDWLDARADVCEDPRDRNTYFVCGMPATAAFVAERRLLAPTRAPRACVVSVTADMILVNRERADVGGVRGSMEFLSWLVQQFECTLGAGTRGTLRAGDAEKLYSARVRAEVLAWKQQLIGIGFYHELAHGSPVGPSLELARQDRAGPDDDRIGGYLAAGKLYRCAEELVALGTGSRVKAMSYDWFVRDVGLEPPHLRTDGAYVWPSDLLYYVRRYHVQLPRSFVVHARRNGWRVPEVDLASLPALEI